MPKSNLPILALLLGATCLGAAQLPEGTSTDPIPAMTKPAKGVPYSDPTYGTRIVRVTNHAAEAPVGFARNDYARRQPFNADDSLQLIIANDGAWHVYRTADNAYVKRLDGLAGDAEPQWHPTDPARLYYLPTNGVGMQVRELNVTTLASRVVGDLGARLRARWPTAHAAWTKAEGSPSADARYWCFMVDDSAWRSLGVICWDMSTDQIVGWRNTGGNRPDHVSMSPSGAWCEISGDDTRAYSRDFATSRLLLNRSEHSDLALDAQGRDVYVAVDYGSNAGSVMMVDMATGVRTDLFPTYLAGSVTALHISGKAFARSGWVLVSTYADSGAFQWLHRKLFALELTANPRIYQLAHTRTASNGYFTEPHAAVNRDFTRVVFNSNWGTPTEDVDAYRIDLDRDALPGSATPPPADTTPPLLSALGAGTLTASSAVITWTTNEAADGQVDYGTTAAYGSSSAVAGTLVTAHSIALGGLAAGTTYHYRVRSRDAAGNTAVSQVDRSFTTASTATPPPPGSVTGGTPRDSGSSGTASGGCGLGGTAALLLAGCGLVRGKRRQPH